MDKFWENYIKTRPANSKGAFDAFKKMNQEPRNMKLAKADIPRHLWDNFNTPDLEQSPDSFLRPGETLEDWDVTFRRPNADGGVIGKPGGIVEPGVEYYGNYVKRTIGDNAFAFGKKQKIWAPKVFQRILSKDITKHADGGLAGMLGE